MVTVERLPLPVRGLDYSVSEYGLTPDRARLFLNARVSSGYLSPRGGVEAVSWVGGAESGFDATTAGHAPAAFIPMYGQTESDSDLGIAYIDGSGNAHIDGIKTSGWSWPGAIGGPAEVSRLTSGQFNLWGVIPLPGAQNPRYLFPEGAGSGQFLSVTGIASESDIAGMLTFKSRTYYWLKDSATFYYTDVGVIPQDNFSVTAFPTGEVSLTSTRIISMTSLSVDSGTGPDDLLVIILEGNECLVYQGSDPGSATDFAIVGRFRSPTPNYAGGFMNLGPDVIVATNEGLYSLRGTMETGAPVEPTWALPINPILRRLKYKFGDDTIIRPVFCPENQMIFVVVTTNGSLADKSDALCFQLDIKSQAWSQISFHGAFPTTTKDERDLALEGNSGASLAVQDVIEYFGDIYFALWASTGSGTTRVGRYDPLGPPKDFRANEDWAVATIIESGEIPLPPRFSPSTVTFNHKIVEYDGVDSDTISAFKFFLASDEQPVMTTAISTTAATGNSAIPVGANGLNVDGNYFRYRIEMRSDGPTTDPGLWYTRDRIRLYDMELHGEEGGPL